ncbi:MAG: tetratricopeptide repeat protein [Hyphomonadaceae bacterium]|nr:tetratricopeptide repeat protein [Hyphomonadaceae bacterium]
MTESSLPQTPDEIWDAIIGAFPPPLQPYVGFVAALLAGLLVVLGLVKPLFESLGRGAPTAVPATGNAHLDALLALEARGKLDDGERRKLKDVLFTHIVAQGATASAGAKAESRDTFDQAIDNVLNEQSSKEAATQLAEFANDPLGQVDAMLARARTAAEFKEAGDLAFLLDTDRAMRAYERALALDPNDLDNLCKLGRCHYRIGATNEARGIWNGLIDTAQSRDPTVFCKALIGLASCCYRESDITASRTFAHRALGAAQAVGARKVEAAALLSLGTAAALQDSTAEAENYFNDALAIGQALDDKGVQAEAISRRALLLDASGNHDEAIELLNKSLSLARESGDLRSQADSLLCLGNATSGKQDYPAAKSHYQAALAAYGQIGDKENAATVMGNLGNVVEELGDLGEASRLQTEALAMHRELGKKEGQANCLFSLGSLAEKHGRGEEAERYINEALVLYRQIGARINEGASLNYLGVILYDRGDGDGAHKKWQEALAIYEASNNTECEGARAARQNLALKTTA